MLLIPMYSFLLLLLFNKHIIMIDGYFMLELDSFTSLLVTILSFSIDLLSEVVPIVVVLERSRRLGMRVQFFKRLRYWFIMNRCIIFIWQFILINFCCWSKFINLRLWEIGVLRIKSLKSSLCSIDPSKLPRSSFLMLFLILFCYISKTFISNFFFLDIFIFIFHLFVIVMW